jgi:hypothetical protein
VDHFVHTEDEVGWNAFGYLDGMLKECQNCFDWGVESGLFHRDSAAGLDPSVSAQHAP